MACTLQLKRSDLAESRKSEMISRSGEAYQVVLDPGIQERLERLSALMNVPIGGLVSHALDTWVATQERSLALIEALAEKVGGDLGTRLRGVLRTGLFERQRALDPRALTEAEARLVGEQESMSQAAAAGLGAALLQTEFGRQELERLIVALIEREKAHGKADRVDELQRVLDQFRTGHLG
jgi:hypothetical protein